MENYASFFACVRAYQILRVAAAGMTSFSGCAVRYLHRSLPELGRAVGQLADHGSHMSSIPKLFAGSAAQSRDQLAQFRHLRHGLRLSCSRHSPIAITVLTSCHSGWTSFYQARSGHGVYVCASPRYRDRPKPIRCSPTRQSIGACSFTGP
jgi:hypothetical protein